MDNQINIKYMFTVIGGGWTRVSRAYFIADDRVYFLNKFSPDDLRMLENHFDDITATLASVNFDTTGLDFVNHGTNVGFDMPTITMYRYEDGKYKKIVVRRGLSKFRSCRYNPEHFSGFPLPGKRGETGLQIPLLHEWYVLPD